MSRVRLHVNIDHIATIRNARGTPYPDPTEGARICLLAGAAGITAHLREDRRHIKDADLPKLREVTREHHSIFNLEIAATDEMVGIAGKVLPDLVTFVPERREERTTEGGLDVVGQRAQIAKALASFRGTKIKTSLFIAPDLEQVRASKELGVTTVEFHTGHYADGDPGELEKIVDASKLASELGLAVAFGHGLTRANVVPLLRAYCALELNIGHAMIADAIFLSLREAVLEMHAAIESAMPAPRPSRPRSV
jgi:pyridoxine 5-phosphate synthase